MLGIFLQLRGVVLNTRTTPSKTLASAGVGVTQTPITPTHAYSPTFAVVYVRVGAKYG